MFPVYLSGLLGGTCLEIETRDNLMSIQSTYLAMNPDGRFVSWE